MDNRRVIKALSLAALLGALACGPAAAQQPPSRADIDAIVEPHIGKLTPGIAVLVMKGGVVLHMKGYGLADIDAGVAVDENTVFNLASLSKQMTGLALMQEIAAGTVTAKTPVAEVLPPFAAHQTGERPLTLDDLLHHVSGLPDYAADPTAPALGENLTNADVVAWLPTQPLLRPPGTGFEYSNSGYVVLGSAVAALAGRQSLAELLAERIWQPLGMQSTALARPAEGVEPKSIARGYSGADGNFTPSEAASLLEGASNVMSTIADLARYEAALAKNTLLDARATDALCAAGTMDDGAPVKMDDSSAYGFGWAISIFGADQQYCWHSGSWAGTATAYIRNRTSGRTVIVLANGESFDATGFAFTLDETAE